MNHQTKGVTCRAYHPSWGQRNIWKLFLDQLQKPEKEERQAGII